MQKTRNQGKGKARQMKTHKLAIAFTVLHLQNAHMHNSPAEEVEPPDSAVTHSHRNLQAGIAMGLVAMASVGTCLPVFRDRLQDYFALSITQFGLLLNTGTAIGVAGALASGPLMARMGAQRTFRLCLAGCATGMLLATWPGSWGLFLAALSVVALFLVPLNISVQASLVELFPERRRQILSLSLVSLSLSGMLLPILAETLLSITRPGRRMDFGWILHGLYAIAAILLLCGVIVTRTSPHRKSQAHPPLSPPSPTLPTGAIVLLVALLSLHGTADTVLHVWIPRVLSSGSYVNQPFLPGAVISAYSLAYVISRSLLTLLPEQRWRRRLMIAPGLFGGIFLLAGILTRDQAWTSIGYVVGAFTWSVECPVFIATLTGAGRRFGSAMAAMTAVSGLATFSLGTALGALGDHLGDTRLWQILLVPASIFPLVGLGGLCWVLRYGHHPLAFAGNNRESHAEIPVITTPASIPFGGTPA